MATIENWSSRTIQGGPSPQSVLTFDIIGSNDDATAEIDLLANSPSTWNGLPRHSYTLSWKAQGCYAAEVTYRLETDPQNQSPPGNVGSTTGQVSLTIAGETVRRITSDATASFGTSPPDYGGAIAVDSTGRNPEGCEVLVPTMQYRETHYFNPASLTQSYRKTVLELAGSINNATWKTFDARSVRFDGAEFGLSDGEKVVANYVFSVRKNETGLTIGGISSINKDGWDFLWVKYKNNVDANDKPVTEAEAVYVETVYPEGDFSTLQIGT